MNSGPAPTSRERSHKAKADAQGWTTLPAEGREGPLPPFPLINPQPREYELWERLWELPQAVQWEASHLDFEVASYVRLLARAELPRSSSMIWAQVKMMGESLGLTASGMLRNRWVVGNVQPDEDAPPSPVSAVASLSERLKAVSGG
ncbi:phage terminase small subunit [Streptomyces sp. SP17KL33]|uniref:phage terminase small subunit n=1 Tax=Streptomyces sp. SP17KL33 TaxID=3002534 RepID=UPI003FCCB87C